MNWLKSTANRLRQARPSRIGMRLLAFNLLVVFLPIAGIFYLDIYEDELLHSQERSMVQQGRLVAAALGTRADGVVADDAGALLARLERRGDARVRVYNQLGALVADSARSPDPTASERPNYEAGSQYDPLVKSVRQRPLYRVGAWLAGMRRWARTVSRAVLVPSRVAPRPSGTDHTASPTPEVRDALNGKYGAGTRPTPGQRSLTLHSAVPVRHGDRVIGAVLVTQSTFRILQALYDIRLRLFLIVVASLCAAVVLSLLMSSTIVRPLVRLRQAALALADRRKTPDGMPQVARRDEIGDLARALDELTRRLDAHIRLLESFSADVSHEFKNPLASIRSATEMIAATDDPADRQRMLDMMTRDVDRLERLVSGVRELARVDAQLAHEALETVDVPDLIRDLIGGLRTEGCRTDVVFEPGPGSIGVRAAPDRLAQVFDNVLRNAVSFAPEASVVQVSVRAIDGSCVVSVEDRGPGIPDAHLDRVFERFFTYRPGSVAGRREHTGLGLAIAKAIVDGYGGVIRAANRDDGGATFEVCLPLARHSQPSSRFAHNITRAPSVS
jgi:two-component system, OmpR family, sensor histidine kinase ChvG